MPICSDRYGSRLLADEARLWPFKSARQELHLPIPATAGPKSESKDLTVYRQPTSRGHTSNRSFSRESKATSLNEARRPILHNSDSRACLSARPRK